MHIHRAAIAFRLAFCPLLCPLLCLLALTLSSTLLIAGCSSKTKSAGGESATGGSGAGSGPAMRGSGNATAATTSESELLERYDLVELNSVANALRLTFEKATEPAPAPSSTSTPASPAAASESVLDCAMTADQAKRLLGPLKVLMDSQTERERESYLQDPSIYARSHGLETCASKCACGALSGVLKPVAVKSLKLPAQKMAHERFLKRLQAKASRQTAEESLACAKKVNWFCSSDLRAFLEKSVDRPGGG